MHTILSITYKTSLSLLAAAILASGCTSSNSHIASAPAQTAFQTPELTEPEPIPVVRYGRYTLVELAPTPPQRDLLQQVIDVTIPESSRTTVGDGLRHVLKRSGYQLCESAPAADELYSLPLPAAHQQLGPMTLRDALLTLSGPAWDLKVDEPSRSVCFARAFIQPDDRLPHPAQPAPPQEQPSAGGSTT